MFVLLIPNLIILIISPKPIYMVIPYIAIPTSIYMYFLSFTRKPGYMIIALFPIIFLGAFQLALITLFKSSVIGADMFTNVFTTNTSEASDVLEAMRTSLILMIILYSITYILSYLSIKSKQTRPISFNRKIRVSSFSTLILGIFFIFISKNINPHYSVLVDIFPINVVNNFVVSATRWNMSKKYPDSSKDFIFNATKVKKNEREIYILIIGESARADKFSIYGYERNTSPRLKAMGDDIVIMTDAITQSNTTHKSTALIMSSVSAQDFEKIYEQKSLVTAFKEAGFKTVFISNQGANGTFMDFYASEANERIDIPLRESDNGSVIDYDGSSLKYVENSIKKSNENLLIVVHTYGSHMQYQDRYSKDFEKFTPASSSNISSNNKELLNNAYDNSILYSDYFISELINIADSSNTCSGVIYLSDHGQDLYDDDRGRFMHASPTLTYYQLHIPFFIWLSPKYKKLYSKKHKYLQENREKSISTNVVFHTMCDMADIKSPHFKNRESIMNSNYNETDRMFLNDLYKSVYFANTELNDNDLILLKKNGIKFNSQLVK